MLDLQHHRRLLLDLWLYLQSKVKPHFKNHFYGTSDLLLPIDLCDIPQTFAPTVKAMGFVMDFRSLAILFNFVILKTYFKRQTFGISAVF